MKVAALHDIHGNPPALEAVLAEPGRPERPPHRRRRRPRHGPVSARDVRPASRPGFHSAVIRGNCERELEEDPHEGLWGAAHELGPGAALVGADRASPLASRVRLARHRLARAGVLLPRVAEERRRDPHPRDAARDPAGVGGGDPRGDDRARPHARPVRRPRRTDQVRQRRERRDAVRGGRGRMQAFWARRSSSAGAVRPRPRGVPDPHQRLPEPDEFVATPTQPRFGREATAYFEQAAASAASGTSAAT